MAIIQSVPTPRTSTTNPTQMINNSWWYSSGNIYYPNYGLPNCTCYCYGRIGEILGHFETRLPSGDGGQWYPNAVLQGLLPVGSDPAAGAVACWYDPNGIYLGHVAVVEYVNDDGSIFTSNSGYPDNYFWTATLTRSSGYRENWMISRGYQLQGFIYAYDMPPSSDNDALLFLALRRRRIDFNPWRN